MVKFIVGLLVGGFVGTMWMAMACIVDDIDELDEIANAQNDSNALDALDALEEPEEEIIQEYRCPFCGGKLSEVRIDDGNEYRYCFGCFHEYEVNDE